MAKMTPFCDGDTVYVRSTTIESSHGMQQASNATKHARGHRHRHQHRHRHRHEHRHRHRLSVCTLILVLVAISVERPMFALAKRC